MTYTAVYPSPLGRLLLASDGEALTGAWFEGQRYFASMLPEKRDEKALPVFAAAARWLDDYFAGGDPGQTPALRPTGTPFQRRVWELLAKIPYGKTTSYGALATALAEEGSPTSARAVGGAVGRNPISILIPCHRVLGADGSLTGYAGGLERKKSLLLLEQGKKETFYFA
jgi:methylated-DNA-[protein]-cysteine S-methyltransferase